MEIKIHYLLVILLLAAITGAGAAVHTMQGTFKTQKPTDTQFNDTRNSGTGTSTLNSATYNVYFCPKDSCSTHVIDAIDNAKSSIHIAMYDFTLKSIANALIQAKGRGVDVEVVIESDDVKGSEYYTLQNAGISIKLDGNPALMHNKYMIIDGVTVETGSFNWTFSANTANNENLIILQSTTLASLYETDFQKIFAAGH